MDVLVELGADAAPMAFWVLAGLHPMVGYSGPARTDAPRLLCALGVKEAPHEVRWTNNPCWSWFWHCMQDAMTRQAVAWTLDGRHGIDPVELWAFAANRTAVADPVGALADLIWLQSRQGSQSPRRGRPAEWLFLHQRGGPTDLERAATDLDVHDNAGHWRSDDPRGSVTLRGVDTRTLAERVRRLDAVYSSKSRIVAAAEFTLHGGETVILHEPGALQHEAHRVALQRCRAVVRLDKLDAVPEGWHGYLFPSCRTSARVVRLAFTRPLTLRQLEACQAEPMDGTP